MNNIYSGTFTKRGLIYDYSGIWKPLPAGISWKAVVRNADVVCRPHGELQDVDSEQDILEAIRQLIEISVTEALDAKAQLRMAAGRPRLVTGPG